MKFQSTGGMAHVDKDGKPCYSISCSPKVGKPCKSSCRCAWGENPDCHMEYVEGCPNKPIEKNMKSKCCGANIWLNIDKENKPYAACEECTNACERMPDEDTTIRVGTRVSLEFIVDMHQGGEYGTTRAHVDGEEATNYYFSYKVLQKAKIISQPTVKTITKEEAEIKLGMKIV